MNEHRVKIGVELVPFKEILDTYKSLYDEIKIN